jgi:hypothetical protein
MSDRRSLKTQESLASVRRILFGGGLEKRHLVRSGADVSATVCATVVAFYRVTVKHLGTSRWNAASSNCSDFPQPEFWPGIFAGQHFYRYQSRSLPASRLPVLIRTMPNWITSESQTIRAEQLRENIRKSANLICRPRYAGIKSWASCHRR